MLKKRQINQGICANRSDNSFELVCQQKEYSCLNLKKCDEQTNRQTNLCIELRYAQLITHHDSAQARTSQVVGQSLKKRILD